MIVGFNGRFLSAPRITGVERVAHEIIKRLVGRPGLESVLFSADDVGDPFGVTRHIRSEMGQGAARRHAWEQFVLPRLVRRERIDLLYNPINSAPLAVENQIVVIHDVAFLPEHGWHRRGISLYYSLLLPRIIARSRGIITVSEFSRRGLIERLGAAPDRVRVIHNGVSPEFRPTDHQEAAERLGLPNRYLLFVGSLEPRKNLLTLLLALERLAASRRLGELRLVLAGCANANFRDAGLGGLLDSLGESVKVLGYVDDADLPALYSGALAFVYPSLFEGFGLPVLEAMACGTPVITSNVSALPEVVGDAGVMVPPSEPEAWAAAIEAVIGDAALQSTLRRKGPLRAAEFTWEAAAAKTWDYMRELKN